MFRTFYIALLMFVHSKCDECDLYKIDSIEQEKPCIEYGGICTIITDCPEKEDIKKRGLCPNQARQGIDCCYGVSVKETRCEKRGGICVVKEKFCAPNLIFRNATGCLLNEKCCILV